MTYAVELLAKKESELLFFIRQAEGSIHEYVEAIASTKDRIQRYRKELQEIHSALSDLGKSNV